MAVRKAHKALVVKLAVTPKTTFFDALEGFQAADGCTISSAGLSIWADHRHLTPTAYNDVWDRLSEASVATKMPRKGLPTICYPAIVNMHSPWTGACSMRQPRQGG